MNGLKKLRRSFQWEPDIPSDYTEEGVEKGAKLSDGLIDNPDLRLFFNATHEMSLDDTLRWEHEHRRDMSERVTAIDTDRGTDIEALKDSHLRLLILERSLNTVRHLNTLLNRSNEVLEEGGYVWCHARTAVLKRRLILKKYPWGVGHMVFALHFMWHRVIPKLNITKSLYFAVTKGQSRTYNRVEVLGRMYRAGFEVVDEEFRHGEFFVLARKFRAPIWDDVPSGSPLIKLRRVGKDRKLIGVYKLRTMYSYSEYLQPYIYEHNHLAKGGKFADDYRVTPWGRWMRKLWIDELPMIWNVIRGDLKLVGVRPLSRHYFSLYSPEMQDLRTRVKPGLLPPGIADKVHPVTIEDVQESERRYLEMYIKHPIKTDLTYMWRVVTNIIIKGARSK